MGKTTEKRIVMKDKIAFIADSCADLPEEILRKENVFTLPVLVNCKGKEYVDGKEITAEQIYALQKEGELPGTSLPTGEMFGEVIKEVLENGYEKAVLFTMSSAISGTWNLCRLLSEECRKIECLVIDSKMASLAEGAILVELLDEVEEGKVSWEEIPHRVEVLQKQTMPFFGIDTLEFLQKNGRIGKATALLGNLLNLMPILSFDENGVIEPIEKVRGKKQRMARLKSHALEAIGDHKKYRLYFVDGGCIEMVEKLKKDILSELDEKPEIQSSHLGCALAAHLGPNLIGVCVQITE